MMAVSAVNGSPFLTKLHQHFSSPYIPDRRWGSTIVLHGWRTYGMLAQQVTWKDSLGMQHSLLSHFFYISLARSVSLLWRTCVYIHTSECMENVYELSLLPNESVRAAFLHKSVAVRSVDWIFIIGAPAGRWLDEYVTLDKTFNNVLFKQEVVAAPVTAIFSSLSYSLRRQN